MTTISCSFAVDTSRLGYDKVEVEVEHMTEKIPHQITQSQAGSQIVHFVPTKTGSYDVSVRCLDKHIEGTVKQLILMCRILYRI